MDSFPHTGKDKDEIKKLKETLVKEILQDFDSASIASEDRNQILVDLIMQKYRNLRVSLPDAVRAPLFHQVIDEVLGFGILQPYFDDPAVTEIMVNGKDNIFIKKNGQSVQLNLHFKSNEELIQLIHRNIQRLGFQIDPDNPVLDERLSDGTRINVVLPPIASLIPILSIQKFTPCKSTISNLLESGMLSERIATFIEACVVTRLNILITGLGATGKTSLLNGIAEFIPANERIITIEEIPELNLHQKYLLRLESKSPRQEGKHLSTPADLIHLALRIHTDRLIIGEIRGSECLALLQTMNTGCSGSMATLHAGSPNDAISRIESMCLMTGVNLPMRVIHEQIASAVDLIIQVSSFKDGSRRITSITEISGMESENVILTDIFRFEQTGIDTHGRVSGYLKPTGIRPLFTSRLEANGLKLSSEVFGTNLADFYRNEQSD